MRLDRTVLGTFVATFRYEMCTRPPGGDTSPRGRLLGSDTRPDGDEVVDVEEDDVVDEGGEGGGEGGGCPVGGSTSARLARGVSDALAPGDGRAPRLAARSSSMCSGGGGGGGDGGGGGSGGGGGGPVGGGGGGGGGGGCVVVGGAGGGGSRVAHHRTTCCARNSSARRVSSACAEARARDRSARVDGSEVRAVVSPLLGSLGLPLEELLQGVHVMLPSAWMRNECMFVSFASAAARRTSRRAARLSLGRDAGNPGSSAVLAVDVERRMCGPPKL